MKIRIMPKARRMIEKLPKDTRATMIKAIDHLQNFPHSTTKQIKKLTSQPGYRLRVGNYRILFITEGDVLYIARVAHRKDAYR